MDILGRRDTDDPEEPDAAPPFSGVVDRIRRLADRLRDAGSRIARPVGSASSPTERTVLASAGDDGAGTFDATPTECPGVAGFPEREYPFTYPARELVGVNSPDVVSVETEEGLRMSMPENADASLTSDVWTDVEP